MCMKTRKLDKRKLHSSRRPNFTDAGKHGKNQIIPTTGAPPSKGFRSSAGSSSPSSNPSESQQTLQVLQPCSIDELCISMSECHSLNPDFMTKTDLYIKVKQALQQHRLGDDASVTKNLTSDPVKIKVS